MENQLASVGGHAFPPLQQIRPMIETVPLAKAAEAYGRMTRNEARFRIVLVTGNNEFYSVPATFWYALSKS